jgi:hypothetical protein
MKVTFNVKGYTDRRTPELIGRYESIEERRRWTCRWVLKQGRPISLGSRLGPMGPDRQGGQFGPPRAVGVWPATADAPFRLLSVRDLLERGR